MLAATMPGVAGAAAKKETTKGKGASTEGVVDAGPGSAKGKGVSSVGETFKFNAKSTKGTGTTIDAAKGKFSIKQGTGFAKGKVQCLEVSRAGGANFAGVTTKSNVITVGTLVRSMYSTRGSLKGRGTCSMHQPLNRPHRRVVPQLAQATPSPAATSWYTPLPLSAT
jgi:hypothetical protein